jgi:hypothetical protein
VASAVQNGLAMLTKVMVLVATLSLVACVDDPAADETTLDVAIAPPAVEASDVARTGDIARAPDERGDICELLPTDPEDPCTYLCDPEKLAEFLPPQQCVMFVCKLSDGTVQRAGGCSL